MTTRRTFLATAAAAPLGLSLPAIAADPFPSKRVRWVVPYSAGGGSDFLTRNAAIPLGTLTNQSVLVDNKVGGIGGVAVSDVVRSPADGHTLVTVDNGMLVYNPAMYKKLTYAPESLRLVTLLARLPMMLVVKPETASTAKEFIEKIRQSPNKFSYGSAGQGSPQHLTIELLNSLAALHMQHVPYKGSAPALADLVGGQVIAMAVDYAASAGFIQSGKLRALAIADSKRHPRLPDVPTFAEIGLTGLEAHGLVGVGVRTETPDAEVHAMQKLISKALADPKVISSYRDIGTEPVGNTPEQFTQLIEAEKARWHPFIKRLNIQLD